MAELEIREGKDFGRAVDGLIDGWCERRNLKPLRLILRAYPMASGLAEDWEELRDALRTIRAFCRDELDPREFDAVVSLIQAADRALAR